MVNDQLVDSEWLAVTDTLFEPVGILVTVVKDSDCDGEWETVLLIESLTEELTVWLSETLLDPVGIRVAVV